MLALAIEFSRCSRARTLKAEQRVPAGARSSPTSDEGDRARRAAGASTWSLPVLPVAGERERDTVGPFSRSAKRLLRKEVIQPQLPLRLPCYDFTPIASPTFDGSLHK